MKLIKSSLYDYERAGNPKRKGKAQLIVEEFLDSGYEYAECIYSDKEYKNAASLQSTLRDAIRNSGYPCVARKTNGRVFLLKTPVSVNV